MRAEFVATVRSFKETPYVAQARLPGVGLDCIGVPIVAARMLGLKPPDFDIQGGGYSMVPDGSLLTQSDLVMTRITQDEMQIGDVIVCAYGKEPHHVGVVVDYRHGGFSIIHAENWKHKKVIEHRLWFGGAMKFVRAYTIPGIDE